MSVLCMLYKIRCNPMHPHYGALPVLYVPVWFTCMLWSYIFIVMHLLTAEPHSTAGLSFSSQWSCGMILPTLKLMVWDWWVSRAGQCIFIGYSCSLPFCFLLCSLSLLSVSWSCGAGVFGLIGCKLFSPSLALLIFFNNNNWIYLSWNCP